MLDIVSMLFTLLRTYIPSEIRWSFIMDLYDMFAWNICMCTLVYCIFFALWRVPRHMPAPLLTLDLTRLAMGFASAQARSDCSEAHGTPIIFCFYQM